MLAPLPTFLVMVAAVLVATLCGAVKAEVIEDDFSTDTGLWKYAGDAYRDATNGYVSLTRSEPGCRYGLIWLNMSIREPFTVEFKYRIGGGGGAFGGGDGMVFAFYKKTNYTPCPGGGLGFTQAGVEEGTPVPGYGVEFDGVRNKGDPSPNHIALIKDDIENHLIYVNDSRSEDNGWHDVRVEVGETSVKVYLDGERLFSWTGPLDRTFGGFGFSAATCAEWNWHIMDDVRITLEEQVPAPEFNALELLGLIALNMVVAVAILKRK